MVPALHMHWHAMLNARTPQTDPAPSDARFRVLLTEDRARPDEHWTRQVPSLLKPLGVQASIASDSKQALEILESTSIHAAVIDLNTPAPNNDIDSGGGGGLWLLQVVQRLPHKPPVVVVNSHSYSQKQSGRMLNQALDLGAFSVVNWPVQIDTLLSTFQRLIERAYNNHWPPPPEFGGTPN
jgi:CheY-like chemotaxis protein